MKLTKKELETLINVVGQVSVPVSQSQVFVALINKMSKMIDLLEKPEPKPKEEKKDVKTK